MKQEGIKRSEYLRDFSNGKQGRALRIAHDIRKFEIELYWKRATYFWTFNALALTGFFAMKRTSGTNEIVDVMIVGCLGLIVSVAWYFANRGSKAWQQNWESQVDLLEDELHGPLYKTTLRSSHANFLNLTGAYPFSVTKLNLILNVYMILFWLGLMVHVSVVAKSTKGMSTNEIELAWAISIIAAFILGFWGTTSRTKDAIKATMHRRFFPDQE